MEAGQVPDGEPVYIAGQVWWVARHVEGGLILARTTAGNTTSWHLDGHTEVEHAGHVLAALRGAHDVAYKRSGIETNPTMARAYFNRAMDLRSQCERLEAAGVTACV